MSAVTELIEALRVVEQHLDHVRRHTGHARGRLSEARDLLTRADPNHPDMVVPPELGRADDQLEHTRQQIDQAAELIREFAARL